jgi:hypothetical protein
MVIGLMDKQDKQVLIRLLVDCIYWRREYDVARFGYRPTVEEVYDDTVRHLKVSTKITSKERMNVIDQVEKLKGQE